MNLCLNSETLVMMRKKYYSVKFYYESVPLSFFFIFLSATYWEEKKI